MSGRLARLAIRSSALSFALVLAAPTAALADGHNPPGNNGTIKIDEAPPADSGHANRPHPGCAFQLRMFGFDDDQYGTVTFVGQAPTKLGTLLTQQHVLLSDDDAGGGQDVDAVYSYTAAQLGLVGQPQAKQGWHVKVSVDADNAPGGAKQKVFWLSCPPSTTTAGTTAGTTSGTAGGAATQSTAATEGSAVTTKSLSTSESSASTTSGARAGLVRSAGAALGAAATAASGATGAGLGATTAPGAQGGGSALPFTGFALAAVLAFGLAALVAGTLAVLAGRRRAAHLSSSR